MKDLVSVIMPVYNDQKYLKESIESILNQTYQNIELLILNDGSNDESLSIIENYAMHNKNIRLISRENKGTSLSLNELMHLVKGKYIARMNGDDVSYPNRIECQVDYLSKNPDVALIGTYVDIETIDYKNEQDTKFCEDIFNFKMDNKKPELSIIRGKRIYHGTFMLNSSICNKIKYNGDIRHNEDMDFLFELLKNNLKFAILEKKLYLNRVDSNFIHNYKQLDLEYEKENLLTKIKFIAKYLDCRDLYICGFNKNSKIAVDIIALDKNINILGFIDNDNVGKKYNDFKVYNISEIDIKNNYFFVIDKFNSSEYEKKLINLGKKELEDFVVF